MSTRELRERDPADLRPRRRDDRPRRGHDRLGRRGQGLPRLLHRHRRRRPRSRPPGRDRRRARAARPPLARVQPLLDRADAPARLAADGARSAAARRSSATRARRRTRRRSRRPARPPAARASSRSRAASTAGRSARSRPPASRRSGRASARSCPGMRFAQPNDVESLEAAVAAGSGADVAAIMIEPVLGEGGVVPLDAGLHERRRRDRAGARRAPDRRRGADRASVAPARSSPSSRPGSSPTS